MSNNKKDKNKDKIIDFLKSEYDLARHEWEYYTELFNRRYYLQPIYRHAK